MTCISKFDWDCLGKNLLPLDGFVTIDNLMIGWQKQFDPRRFATLFDFQSCLEHFVFNQRLSYGKAFGLQERISHRAADQQSVHLSIDQSVNDRNLVRDLGSAEE